MRRNIICWALVIIWGSVIFMQSHKPADVSSQGSSYIVESVNRFIGNLTGKDAEYVSEYFIRKTAHFLEYFLLGALLFIALNNILRLKATMFVALGTGAFYAFTDELHQYFIPGRAMLATDILLDSFGVICAVLILYWIKLKKAGNKAVE